MLDFSQRSRKEELLDAPDIAKNDLFRNLSELDYINRKLGGHAATIKGLSQLVKEPDKEYHIRDYACGGGDTLKAIANWANRKGFKVKLSGFDLLASAIEYAELKSKEYDITYFQADFNDLQDKEEVDIAINALVCHHFYDLKLEKFIQKQLANARCGVVINDLHRHWLAYYSIASLSNLFSKSYLVKHDAKLSVAKGFKSTEWNELLEKMGTKNYEIKWVWAFRHLILIRK